MMTGVLLFLAIGSFAGGGEESGSINDMPLFLWLQESPVSVSWWLWITIALLALLVINTILCSIETIVRKYRQVGLVMLLTPQLMHAGFLLIVLAHLFSAYGGFKQVMQLQEGSTISFPDGAGVQIGNIAAKIGPMGMMSDYSAEIRLISGVGTAKTIRPNDPFFYQGFGVYLKDVRIDPFPAALVEVHKEPGAGLALAGALFFTVGNVSLLALRRKR